MNVHEHIFQCPLPNGLHARPASQLADVAKRFAAEITLTKLPGGVSANAKSVLAIVAADIRLGDTCRLLVDGADGEAAIGALAAFVVEALPRCDEALTIEAAGTEVILPRSLRKTEVRWYPGTVASPGIGRGAIMSLGGLVMPAALVREPAGTPEQEQEKVARAIDEVRAAIEADLAAVHSATEAGILRAHLSIANDVALVDKIAELVRAGRSAGQAIIGAGEFFVAQLRAAESAYVRERAADVEDICLQLLEQVSGERFQATGTELTQPSVVTAENLTPRQLLAMDRRHLTGLVLEHAGTTSHVVILARSFDIPTLVGVAGVRANLPAGREAIVDANLGVVIPEVTAPIRRYYDRQECTLRRRQDRFAPYIHAPAATRDGRRLEVAANVGTAAELATAFAQGADGIGLFRTEMLFMDRDAAPSEDEQFALYVQAARTAGGRPVIIRTLDVGGDKPLPYLDLPQEANPFLGYRGVRIYPGHPEVFRAQLRAIVRASAFGKVWVMAPMVCALEEVRWVKAQVTEVQADMKSTGVAFDAAMPVGIMVEVPSAAFIVDQLAAEIDFLSIGTNDLAQYFLAVDRDGDKVAGLYSTSHPSFLRLLAKVVEDARRCGCWVGMCGEMTRDPANLPLLVGLGLDEISTAAPQIPGLKAAIAELCASDCRAILEMAMACGTVAEVEQVLGAFRSRATGHGLLDVELIAADSDSTSKEEAIKEIVDAFYVVGRTDRPGDVEEAVWAREDVYSTGVGHGFAIPHCKTDALAANSIGVVRLSQPVEWQSVDGEPVQMVILLAIRESDRDDSHMKILSKLARRLMHDDFRARLLAAADREAVLRCLAEELGIPAQQVS